MNYRTIASAATLGFALSIGSAFASEKITEPKNTNMPTAMTDEEMDAFVGAGEGISELWTDNLSNAVFVSNIQMLNSFHSLLSTTGGILHADQVILANPSP